MHKFVCDGPVAFCSKLNGNANHQRIFNESEMISPPRKYRRESATIYTRHTLKSTYSNVDRERNDSIATDGNENQDGLMQGNLKFTKSQIYFEFVPPFLNNFEYVMTKLSNIENSLHRQFPMTSLEPELQKYKAFTFVHGDHLETKTASLTIFDAEPEEKQIEHNENGIVVVYLDRAFSFDMLNDMIKHTSAMDIKGKNTFLAVQSEQLLRDRSKLRSLFRPKFGEGLHVLDANGKMEKLYEKFTEVAEQAFKDLQKRIYEVKNQHGVDEILRGIEEQFSSLYKLHSEDKTSQTDCGTIEITKTCKLALSRLKEQGLQGYTTENNTLILCFSHSAPEITEKMIPEEIRQRFAAEHLKIIRTTDPLFKPHHKVESGDKLHPYRQNAGSYGTVGMFGSICQKNSCTMHRSNECTIYQREEFPKPCCISSPHVISSGQTAYVSDAAIALGNCIWPPAAEDYCINVEDISVICLESLNIEMGRKIKESVTLFDGNRRSLARRKVYKFGAATTKTTGFIRYPEFEMIMGNPINVFLIEPDNDSSRFSKEGDSGAIVLTKFGEKVVALSMIFGGDVNFEGLAKNISIAVDLNQAVNRFKDKYKDVTIELDTL